jgi:endonuclease YncB( thermonuclease family)
MDRSGELRFDVKPIVAIVAALCSLGLVRFVIGAEKAPTPSITLPCTVVEVTDGDTVVVQLRLVTSVRLKDCWAQELGSGGEPAKRRLTKLAEGKDATLSIDLTDARRLGDVFSFGRVVGTLWIDGNCVNRQLVKEGLASKSKP